MCMHLDSPGPAGSALRTTGDSRRGRCEKRTGAGNAVSLHAFVHAPARLAILISSRPAPHRFAHRAAPLSAKTSSSVHVCSSVFGSIKVPSPARPSSAHAPGRSCARSLSVLVELSAIVPSMIAPTAARVARRESPVGSTHAQRLSSTSVVSRSSASAKLHNPGLQLTRFAALARS